ncbi:hypothetical protein CEXT_123491, partial [Caerostris extrusa]
MEGKDIQVSIIGGGL